MRSVLARYVWLWLLGLSVGWFEASVVVYLRALYFPHGFSFPLILIPEPIARVEIVREAASILLLAAAARLAGQRGLERWAAFSLLFGVWDLTYYAALWLLLGWPATLADWDVLFLIPVPWLGPVWAPMLVALSLVIGGSYLYLTPARPRRYRLRDWLVASAGGLIVVAAFVADWRAVPERRVPAAFPALLFVVGWLVALGQFLWAECVRPRRHARARSSS